MRSVIWGLNYRAVAWAIAAYLCAGAARPSDATQGGSTSDLQEVVVSAEQPGPGLWRVSKGDHVLWVLGTVSVLPKHMKWKTDEVNKVLASSRAILSYPGATPDANIGLFSIMMLLPSVMGIEELPNGANLQQVLPPPLYTRWTVLRQKYLGDSRRLERLRPFIAADKLTDEAYDKTGLTDDSLVISAVHKLAKQYKVKKVDAEFHFLVKDPKGFIKNFKKTSVDESACFNYELDHLEHSLAESAVQANAWATGDVAALKSSLEKEPEDPCFVMFSGASFVKDLGIEDIVARINEAWASAAEKSLSENQQSFAMLGMRDVLLPDGVLAMLEARGYTVLGPDQTPYAGR